MSNQNDTSSHKSLSQWAKDAHENSRAHGWYDRAGYSCKECGAVLGSERDLQGIDYFCPNGHRVSELGPVVERPMTRREIETAIPEKIALIHSEASEALEVYRSKFWTGGTTKIHEPQYDGAKPVGFDSELADVVIRVLDLAEALGINIERAVEEKHEFNKTRPHRHGGKVC